MTRFQGDLATSHQCVAWLLGRSGKWEEACRRTRRPRTSCRSWLMPTPAVTEFKSDLAQSHYNIGKLRDDMGQPREAMAAKERALEIYQKLADANPAETAFQPPGPKPPLHR